MKLKIKITGPKVHDVGYRYFLMSMAMSNRIRMFEAHNMEGDGDQEVLAFVDGDEKAIEAFRALAKTRRPLRSEVSNIAFDDFDGDIMRIGEYAQFCSTVQLNKAIPLLLDIRDDIKEMKADIKEMKEDIKAIKKNTDMIPQMCRDIKEMKTDIKEMKEDVKAVRKTTDESLGEIKGLRMDIEPSYGTGLQRVQADIRAIKERLGMT